MIAGVLAAAVYAITNPFVLINALTAPQLLTSNLGNSTAMYGVRGPFAMLPDAWRIAAHAMTPVGLWFAVALVLSVAANAIWRAAVPAAAAVPLASQQRRGVMLASALIAPALLVAIQFILLAAGKPAEYARFGLVAFAAMCVLGALAVRSAFESPLRVIVPLLLFFAAALFLSRGHRSAYDAWKWPGTDHTALQLDTLRRLGSGEGATWRLGVAYEPAPWSTPPLNLFDQQIVLIRATPTMLNEVDAFVWPTNLESQVFDARDDHESIDWRANRFGHRAEARDGEPDRWRGGW